MSNEVKEIADSVVTTGVGVFALIHDEIVSPSGQFGNWKWVLFILIATYHIFKIRNEMMKKKMHEEMLKKIEKDNLVLRDKLK